MILQQTIKYIFTHYNIEMLKIGSVAYWTNNLWANLCAF